VCLIIKKTLLSSMKIDMPLPCPSCGGKMYSARYDASFIILKR
jgi:hypothetical protein